MQVQAEERDIGRVLVFKGELTIYQVAALKAVLLDELQSRSEITLDLEQVSELDTAALQVLVALLRSAANQGKLARLLKLGAAPAGVIRLCCLQQELGVTLA